MPLGAADITALTGRRIDFPLLSYAGLWHKGKKPPIVVAYGGLCWRFTAPEGNRARCDIWVDVLAPELVPPLTLVRWGQRMLRQAAQLGESAVYCIRDEHPNSEKLLRLAGLTRLADGVPIIFEDGDTRTGEVWEWRPSQPSEQS